MNASLSAATGLRENEERLRAIFDALNDGIIVHDIDTGAFIDVNLRLCTMFGYAREEMLRLQLADLSAGIAPYTMAEAVPLLQRARSGAPVLFEWLCRTKEGRQLWIEVSLRRARFGGRDVLLSAARDVSQRKDAERALRASETKYRDLFEHTLDAILTIDPSSAAYTSANAGTVRLFGAKDAAEFLGRRPSDYSPERQPDGRASAEKQVEMLETALRAGTHFFEWTHQRHDGTEFPADVLLTRVEHEGRAVIYATVRDVAERKRATETIRLQADQYATMLATTISGYWVLDTQGRFIEVNDAYCRMTGYSREELLQLRIADLEANESPEQVERHMAAIMADGFGHFESRHRCKDGSLIDIEASVSFWRNGSRFLVFARDISARKRAEQELARSEIRLRTVLDTAVDGIAAADVETKRLLFVNRSLCNLLGYSAEELRTLGIADIHPSEALPEVWRQFQKQLQGEAHVVANLPVRRKDGSVFLADLSASPMSLDGRTLMVACFRDVTDRNRAEEQMRRLARYDLLTGLGNRRIFVEALNQSIARARRNGRSFAVLYLDLDHFKDVNDTLGHPVGDLLLQAVADRLRAAVREGDSVARFGGDEFAVLVADVDDPMDVAAIADRVREVLENTVTVRRAAAAAGAAAENLLRAVGEPFTIEGREIHSGTSIGIAVFGSDSTDAETMLSHADVALYRAKSEARGSYRFFSPAMEADVRARVAMGIELRAAIAAEQLFLVYQP
ncbi:MAG TPA: PAS domain S-box protein, partial [Steroidobacteraceae bacterium]|nr:PAS domain S-box protein [Steroidobacteraceae bacterium]